MGAHQITATEPNQQRQTVDQSGYRLHEGYNTQNLNNDIAILILPQAATINQFVVLSVLPALGRTDSFAGVLAQATGWGEYPLKTQIQFV
jgi:secreted trypsin-like serine protease